MTEALVGKVSKLSIRPIKGAGTIEVASVFLTPSGLEGDKEYMVVRAAPNDKGVHEFITQRDKRDDSDASQGLSVLSLIRPSLTDISMQLTWQGVDPIELSRDINSGTELPIRVWDTETYAVDQGDDVAEWLSDHLQLGVRLVKAAGSFQRMAPQNYMHNNNPVRFQDGYPGHWFPQESVDELSGIAGQDIPWTRFRPNIVVEGIPAQSEHLVLSGKIADVPFYNPKPCDRCPVTMVDQDKGYRVDSEPLNSLNKYKRWRNIRGELKVIFGENMLPAGAGKVTVGDELSVTDFRNPALVYGAKV